MLESVRKISLRIFRLRKQSEKVAWQHDLLYSKWLSALRQVECPICWLCRLQMQKHIYWFLYQNVNDPEIRTRIRTSYGFCSQHAWQAYDLARSNALLGTLGIAIIYRDVTNATLKALECSDIQVVDNSSECLFCQHACEMENRDVQAMAHLLTHSDFRELYIRSYGLCMPHFFSVRQLTKTREGKSVLAQVQRQRLEELLELLGEYIRKHDYRFSKEPLGKEQYSPNEALQRFVGKRI